MKKRIVLMTAIAGLAYVLCTGYASGPAFNSYNRTGALSSPTTCGGGGCHGSGTGPAVTITVDSATTSTAVTHYVPGKTYTIKVHGAGTTNSWYGFEFVAVSGTGASQLQAGTFSSLPTGVFADTLWLSSGTTAQIKFIEHHAKLAATSAGVYDVSFQWTAPTSGVGNITMYCTLNAVNGNNNADGTDLSGNTFVVLPIMPGLSVSSETAANTLATVFPNPVMNNLNIRLSNAQSGSYSVKVFDLNGKCIDNETIEVSNFNTAATINTSSWIPGLYEVAIENNGSTQVIPVVKQ